MQALAQDHSLLTADERGEILGLSHSVSYPARTVLVREHELSDFVLYIDRGVVRVVAGVPSTTVALHGPDSVVGHLAVLSGEPRSADLIAFTPVEALYIPGRTWREFIYSHPRSMMAHLEELARQHRSKDLSEESTISSERKFARLIIRLNELGLCERAGDGYSITGLTQRDLGALANISRESVSAALRQLREQGTISSERSRIEIHDIDAIRDLAEREDRSA